MLFANAQQRFGLLHSVLGDVTYFRLTLCSVGPNIESLWFRNHTGCGKDLEKCNTSIGGRRGTGLGVGGSKYKRGSARFDHSSYQRTIKKKGSTEWV
jgi:hypothetical protein